MNNYVELKRKLDSVYMDLKKELLEVLDIYNIDYIEPKRVSLSSRKDMEGATARVVTHCRITLELEIEVDRQLMEYGKIETQRSIILHEMLHCLDTDWSRSHNYEWRQFADKVTKHTGVPIYTFTNMLYKDDEDYMKLCGKYFLRCDSCGITILYRVLSPNYKRALQGKRIVCNTCSGTFKVLEVE